MGRPRAGAGDHVRHRRADVVEPRHTSEAHVGCEGRGAGAGASGEMTPWVQWIRQPKTTWQRRPLFLLHVWAGLALGLYVVVLSLSGSALVFRDELIEALETPVP